MDVRRGKLTHEEGKQYGYKVDPADLPESWFIHFEGQMVLTIVCLDIEVEELDLGSRYPHLAQW
ncbi:hypothetical protein [Polyangium sp. 15x6]|uniref:hypothetical protein n=1 Tax=Polyangium sp. 15x6 TaxID=3042687 RepID=UPI00249A3CB1|nr:hypothetical protein [Polyangium sp. 15x6]MDI3288148.1 hypothetical protein [Polyangium sp. 15x6]